jgi:hypothetical protein
MRSDCKTPRYLSRSLTNSRQISPRPVLQPMFMPTPLPPAHSPPTTSPTQLSTPQLSNHTSSTSTPISQAPPPRMQTPQSTTQTPILKSLHGSWSLDETSKLQSLARESDCTSNDGVIDWNWVINQMGGTRSRHQILIKATELGLKREYSEYRCLSVLMGVL